MRKGIGTQIAEHIHQFIADMVVSMCAQVGALSRSFRWGPFLPVRLDDSLLHVLLLLSKHHLQAVPVVAAESEDATVKGFITQVMSLLFSENLLIHRTKLDSDIRD